MLKAIGLCFPQIPEGWSIKASKGTAGSSGRAQLPSWHYLSCISLLLMSTTVVTCRVFCTAAFTNFIGTGALDLNPMMWSICKRICLICRFFLDHDYSVIGAPESSLKRENAFNKGVCRNDTWKGRTKLLFCNYSREVTIVRMIEKSPLQFLQSLSSFIVLRQPRWDGKVIGNNYVLGGGCLIHGWWRENSVALLEGVPIIGVYK